MRIDNCSVGGDVKKITKNITTQNSIHSLEGHNIIISIFLISWPHPRLIGTRTNLVCNL